MSKKIDDLKTSYPHINFDEMFEESAKDLADEIDKDILDRISLKECNYMLSLTTTHETIILKKRTHEVFNQIRYNELGIRENYMIKINKDYSSSFQPNAIIGGMDCATKDSMDSMSFYMIKLNNSIGIPSKYLSKDDHPNDDIYDDFLSKYRTIKQNDEIEQNKSYYNRHFPCKS